MIDSFQGIVVRISSGLIVYDKQFAKVLLNITKNFGTLIVLSNIEN
jgi:hypothetical protein